MPACIITQNFRTFTAVYAGEKPDRLGGTSRWFSSNRDEAERMTRAQAEALHADLTRYRRDDLIQIEEVA